MKQSILLLAAMSCAVAATAQLTPASYIEQLGSLPMANEYVDCIMDDKCQQLEALSAKAENLRKQAQAAMQRSGNAMAQNAMNQKVAGTNYTAADIQKMSKAEQQAFAQQAAASQLAGMGMSMSDLQKVQSGQMSGEALAAKMVQQSSGFTAQEIKAMQNMSEAEMQAFVMKKHGVASPAQLAAQQQKTTDKEKLIKLQYAANSAAYSVLQNYIGVMEANYATKQKISKIYDQKYHSRFLALDKRLSSLRLLMEDPSSDGKKVQADIDAVQAQYTALLRQYYSETVPMTLATWNAALVKLRTQSMAEAKKHAAAYGELHSLTGEAKYTFTDEQAWIVANAYAEPFNNVMQDLRIRNVGENYTDEIRREEAATNAKAQAALAQQKAQLEVLKQQLQ